MASSIEEIRRRLSEQKASQSGAGYSNKPKDLYPFWNAQESSTSIVRFLPDADEQNVFFWKEKLVIKLPFSGILGGDESKPVTVVVPCAEMFNMTCPVLSTVRSWFIKDTNKSPTSEEVENDKLARSYWKKRSYIFQGFVVQDGIPETETPENPIRRFVINPSIIEIIRSGLFDVDMDDNPTDFTSGCDFKITKTRQGQHFVYTASNWSRKTRTLSSEERAAIDQYGLKNLSDYLPKKPTAEGLDAIKEMFESSVAGELYDPSKWADFYKPFGMYSDVSNRPNTSNEDSNNSSSADSKESDNTNDTVKEDDKETSEISDALAALRKRVSSTETENENTKVKENSDEETTKAEDVLKLIRERGTIKS